MINQVSRECNKRVSLLFRLFIQLNHIGIQSQVPVVTVK